MTDADVAALNGLDLAPDFQGQAVEELAIRGSRLVLMKRPVAGET